MSYLAYAAVRTFSTKMAEGGISTINDTGISWRPGYGAIDLPAGTKIKTKFVFRDSGIAGSFDSVCSEGSPQPDREIGIHDLKPD
jgi:hypothetical protein